ncbi:hypothetical protein [Flavobacterium inviolabile]|uniref:hypothetical protein n=1 Tax=Flavobacterium inviolabile TaxID=2748320 RepID=UPI0015B25CF5|nr:hypothetical protein [Flavobacterium inviolabile]
MITINPEADFFVNPRGGYQNLFNADGKEVFQIILQVLVLTNFVLGLGERNLIVIGGDLKKKSVQNWKVVKGLFIKNIINGNGR